jgi:branched-chain amino acid transport system ATP-binding protein
MLKVRNIETFYGVAQALFDVSLDVKRGQFVALMGRNGMGKTTTINSIMGLTRAQSGTIEFEGRDLRSLKPYQIAQLGIGLVPEGRRVFGPLSVEHNLLATERATSDDDRQPWDLNRVYEFFPRLEERSDQLARTLSGGEQQMLAIGRALLTNPKLLILDEATEGLAPLVRLEIWRAIGQLKQQGLTLLVVDRNLKELAEIADLGVVLEKGQLAWSGAIADLTADEKVKARFLGV